MSTAELTFIIVNYNTAALLKDCVTSIQNHTTIPHTIVVVDNNSSDNSVALVQQQFPNVYLIQNKENSGYPIAVNQGLQAVDSNYYFILNSDIQIQEHCVLTLLNYMEAHPHAGICAPFQFTPDGQPILSVYPYPTLTREWTRNLFFTDYRRYRLRGTKLAQQVQGPQAVEWVMGAAMFVRRSMVSTCGYMDEAIFMYGEEMDWCYRAQAKGWQIHIVPDAKIMHYQSASADIFLNTNRYQLIVKSNFRFFFKYYKHWQFPFFLMAQFIGSFIRMILAFILCLLGKKSFRDQMEEHYKVLVSFFDPELYRWVRQ